VVHRRQQQISVSVKFEYIMVVDCIYIDSTSWIDTTIRDSLINSRHKYNNLNRHGYP